MADEYNVSGTAEKLRKMVTELSFLKVTERFSSTDWNVVVNGNSTDVDNLYEWCETNEVGCKLV